MVLFIFLKDKQKFKCGKLISVNLSYKLKYFRVIFLWVLSVKWMNSMLNFVIFQFQVWLVWIEEKKGKEVNYGAQNLMEIGNSKVHHLYTRPCMELKEEKKKIKNPRGPPLGTTAVVHVVPPPRHATQPCSVWCAHARLSIQPCNKGGLCANFISIQSYFTKGPRYYIYFCHIFTKKKEDLILEETFHFSFLTNF